MNPGEAHDSNRQAADQIAFIGGGNMAGSLVGGLIDAGTDAAAILVCEPDAERRDRLAAAYGVKTTAHNHEALRADAVVLAVKPQQLRAACEQLQERLGTPAPTFISIAAGVRSEAIDRWLGGGQAIIRCMPNTPALLRCGATGLFANAGAGQRARQLGDAVLSSVGITEWVDDEALLDAITAVSGSGPAYYFLLMEAMQQAAVELGLDAEVADRLVTQTALGAARMKADSADAAGLLRQRVTSRGGTTERAIEAFEQAGFKRLVSSALAAACERSAELADELADRPGAG